MATGVNMVILVGNLGRDPELRYTPSGQPVASFSLATTESWAKDGAKQERTEWHRIVVWGKLGELCTEHLAKGRQVYLQGKIQSRKYQDKDGQERTVSEIIAFQVQFLGGKSDGPRRATDDMGYATAPLGGESDDIPF